MEQWLVKLLQEAAQPYENSRVRRPWASNDASPGAARWCRPLPLWCHQIQAISVVNNRTGNIFTAPKITIDPIAPV